jgi:hypothetical protein
MVTVTAVTVTAFEFRGGILILSRANTNARREREASFQSCPYTPTAVHLYPNGFVPIPNLKRIFFLFIR